MINKDIEELYKRIKRNWDNLGKPIDGLGEFENVLSKIGAMQGSEKIQLDPAALLIFVADNGIIEEGVSQSGCEVTYEVAKALSQGYSTVCHMAKASGMDVNTVNIGIKMDGELPGIIDNRISMGTRNFIKEPAMTEDEVDRALTIGINHVKRLKECGYKIIALGEMGIGNTTTSAAVLAGIKKLSAGDVCSTGAGLSADGLNRKIQVVSRAIQKYDLYNLSEKEILRCVGGLDIAALTGAILECADSRIPVISDGFITGVAALIALRINPLVKDVVIFSHAGREKGLSYILEEFEAKPVITASMALGEGTGTCIFMSAAKCALSVYDGNTSFSDINIENYKRY